MDNSTDGVTLYAAFVLDVVALFRDLGSISAPLVKMVEGLDPKYPLEPVPMTLYNSACAWVEHTFGDASLRDAGRRIGEGSFRRIADRAGTSQLRPQEILRELARSARLSIQDPHGRGWEILSEQPRNIVMRRTQTFHCVLQEGLIMTLIEKTGVLKPKVVQQKCTRRGDEYCEYAITWLADKR